MSTVPKLNAAMGALFDIWTALPGLGGIPVYDTPVTADVPPDYVVISDDGDPQSTARPTYEQEWTDIACIRRLEVGEIPCAVVTQSGSTDVRAVGDRNDVLLGAIETSLVADQTLGGVVMGSSLVRWSANSLQNANGSAVVAPFTIRYVASV